MSILRAQLDALAESREAEVWLRSFFRQAVFVMIILAVWISTKPFNVAPTDGTVPSSDIVNQLTFSSLAVLAFIGITWSHRRALMPLLQPSYVMLFAVMVVSVVQSTYLGISFRAFAFTSIVMFLAATLFVLPERFRQFQTMFLLCCLATLALSYFGVIALPDRGMHTDFDPFEPEHAGSWKGHYDHKNIAGGAMACFAIAGIYAIRVGREKIGWALLVGGVIFLYFTKSKTALGLLPVSVFLVWLTERYRSLPMRLLICIGPVVLLIMLTLGSSLVPEIRSFNKLFMKDTTFTGRFDIWRYGFEMLAQKPWLGYGFEAFWQTDTTLKGESRLELAWAVEKIIHGHSSYLDVMMTTGLIGFAVVFYAFIIKPVFDYHRTQPGPESQLLASMFLGMWIFIALDMCLETYIFRRADPVWFTLLIAVFGLRFTASYPVDPGPSQAGQASSGDA